jgi:hypothetical protein
MNRRNGNWQAPSINQLTATAATVRVASCGYRSIKLIGDASGRGEVGANTDQVNAMLIKPEQSSARPAMVTARKLLEANSSRMAHLD